MEQKYSVSEVIELGVQIEKNGYVFYTTLAENTKNKDCGHIFHFLAGEEEKHIDTFMKILETVQTYEPQESYPDEYFAHMHNLANEHVFTQVDKGKEIAQTIKDDLPAIDMALTFENDSIFFFDTMKKCIPHTEHPIIDELIEQEKKHIEKLSLLKSTY